MTALLTAVSRRAERTVPGKGRISMAERVFEYLKRSLTIAWKSVFFNFRQYLCFFMAIMIVQVLYGTMTVAADNNNHVEYQHVTEEYSYHLIVKDLNETQAYYLMEEEEPIFKSQSVYKIMDIHENLNYMTGKNVYDLYLRLENETDKDFDPHYYLKLFKDRYVPTLEAYNSGEGEYTISTTSLLTFEDNIKANAVSFVFITILLAVVCVFLLTALYNIRVNQYKFTYGVYLTFGADFKMLFGTAFWELFVIFIVTFVPSVLLSVLLAWAVYSTSGCGFVFSGWAILKIFIFSLVVIAASVWTPMKAMAVKDPMDLIVTEDNSNLVSSPRVSFSIFGEKFPTRYEFYSIWRFRKYNIQLLSTAIVFCALFIMGLYMADIFTTDLAYPRPQFTVDLSESGFPYDEEMSSELYALDGVRAVEINNNTTEALHIGSHMLVEKKHVKAFKNLVAYHEDTFDTGGEPYRVSNDVVYTAMSEEQLQILSDYDYEGDLMSLVTEPDTVIVGESVSNVPTYKYKVGDTVYIAKKTGQSRSVDANATDRALLNGQLDFFEFEYKAYKIGAVIYDIPCGSTPIFMTTEDYTALTGAKPSSSFLSIYTDKGLSVDEAGVLYDEIRDWGRMYGSVEVENTHRALINAVDADRHYTELFVVIALMVLSISPLVWFFSQSLYYGKREKEFNILQSIGAVMKEIRQIYLQGGICMAAMSLVVSVALSYIGSYALFYIYNVIMPHFTGENVRYVFYMPWYAILTSVVMSVACGFLSTYLPYRSYRKHRRSLQNGGAGEEFGGNE
ncbi:MAG: ABC transporter permease [Ruminococcaceae bacterium]|nr:ABC transporter permease [Oscillospiraceae bacterium]